VAVSTTKAYTHSARIKDKPKVDFTLRLHGKALVDLLATLASSIPAAALVGRRDAHVFTVFGDGAAGELDALRLQQRG